MNKKLKIKIMIDCLMFIALMLLMSYQMVGKEAHEWIGMIMFFLIYLSPYDESKVDKKCK